MQSTRHPAIVTGMASYWPHVYNPATAYLVLWEMQQIYAGRVFPRLLQSPRIIATTSLFLGSMRTYFALSSVNKAARRGLVGDTLQCDSAGNRPWAWLLRRGLPCLSLCFGDEAARAVSHPSSSTRLWAALMPTMPCTQQHAAALVQTARQFRVVVVLQVCKKKGQREWPRAMVAAVLSSVDGSDGTGITALRTGTLVTLQSLASASGRQHLYLVPETFGIEPLFVCQLGC